MSSTTKIEIRYTPIYPVVELRWTTTPSNNDNTRRAFEESLEGLPGVESARVRKFSATVDFAPHVVRADEVAKSIATLLEEGWELWSPWLRADKCTIEIVRTLGTVGSEERSSLRTVELL